MACCSSNHEEFSQFGQVEIRRPNVQSLEKRMPPTRNDWKASSWSLSKMTSSGKTWVRNARTLSLGVLTKVVFGFRFAWLFWDLLVL